MSIGERREALHYNDNHLKKQAAEETDCHLTVIPVRDLQILVWFRESCEGIF